MLSNTSILEKLNFGFSKQLTFIRQTEAAECGLACLAMVLNYHGRKTDLNALRTVDSISAKGASLVDLIKISADYGLASRALKLELKDIPKLQLPAIIHWDMSHFVVLKKVQKNGAIILDPGKGEVFVSLAELDTSFTGIALELTPNSDFVQQDDRIHLKLSSLWQEIKGLKTTLSSILLLTVLLQAFVLLSPYFMRVVTDEVLVTNDYNLLLILAGGFLMVALLEVIIEAIRSFVILRFGNQISIQLGSNLLYHLFNLPLSFFEKRQIGDLHSRFESLQEIRKTLSSTVVEGVVDGVFVITTLVIMFFYDSKITLIIFAFTIAFIAIRTIFYKPFRNHTEELIFASASNDTNLLESIRGIQAIKIFNKETERLNLWQNNYVNVLNADIKLHNNQILFNALSRGLFGIENVVVIYFLATMVLSQSLTLGMLFAYLAYKRQFSDKLIRFVEKAIEFKLLRVHLNRISDIAHSKQEELSSSSQSVPIKNHVLKIENLGFSYSKQEKDIFSSLNLTIQEGESVAIVGPSGVGKTTLLKLMIGLFKPTSGEVSIGGISIEQLGLKTYRKAVSAVMQEDQLYAGTIAENISFFEPGMNLLKVIQCASTACVNDDIMKMPLNYNTYVGDMGSVLSGGQKQRVLLARALHQEPKILFLDEATSHLNHELEMQVNTAVSQLKLTRVIIAHRKETVLSADRIVVLNETGLEDISREQFLESMCNYEIK